MTAKETAERSVDQPAKADAAAPEISYEQARAELDQVVAMLESGGGSLTESVEVWQRGEKLAGICQQWLDGVQTKLDKVADG